MRLPKPSRIATALFIAFVAPLASAAPTTVGATSSAEAPLGVPGTTSDFSSLPSYASSFSSANAGLSNGYGSAFSRDNGAFAVGSSATGSAQGLGTATTSTTVINTTGVAQHYFLRLKIYGGSIGTFLNDSVLGALTVGERLSSAYFASVTFGGTSVFMSGAAIDRTESGVDFEHIGTVLEGAESPADTADGVYSWGLGYYDIDLGVLGAGQSAVLDTALAGGSYANVGTYDFSNGNNGYGYGCFIATEQAASPQLVIGEGECVRPKGYASQFYGDPQDLSTDVFVLSNVPVDRVPEPAPLALLGLGLAAAAASRRRKAEEPTEALAEGVDRPA